MIQTTELRRGNMVFDEHNIAWYVYQIFPMSVELANDMSGSDDCDHSCDEIFGIPLNIVNIKDLGFTDFGLSDQAYYHPKNRHHLYLTDGDNFIYRVPGNSLKSVKYVHEIQNIFWAISGEELKVRV